METPISGFLGTFIFFLFNSLKIETLRSIYILLIFLLHFEHISSFCRETTSFGEMCEDSEIMEAQSMIHRPRRLQLAKVPQTDEIEEFFATEEKYQQKRFADKWVFINLFFSVFHRNLAFGKTPIVAHDKIRCILKRRSVVILDRN